MFVVGCFQLCTLELRSSLSITAEDENGARVSPDTVTVTRADGSAVEVTCAESAARSDCAIFAAGQEEVGDFIVTGTFQGLTDTQSVSVDADQCHVTSQAVVLVFTP